MSATSESQSWFEARYGGTGYGWFVDRMEPHGSYTSRYNYDGPFTTREQAEKVAADMTRGFLRGPNQGYPHPIAYTYDADYHCPACTGRRFGVDAEGWIPQDATDSEGNPVGAVAPWDEWQNFGGGDETLVCGTCGGIIDEWEDELEHPENDVRELARRMSSRFTRRTRPDGGQYTILTDAADEWMRDVIREAHGSMLPDDWRYDAIASAVEFIADNDDYDDRLDEWADGYVDVYTAGLIEWVGSNLARPGYVDAYYDETGDSRTDFATDLMRGQFTEAREIIDLTLRALEGLV